MAIHKNDDYEKLAKLFYPSIEASGNVYYGQTRKLTMDEVLGKNDFGFESHIESFRVDDDSEDYGFKYINCLCWKLGPLSDTITLDDDNYPLEGMYGYAKYKLIVSDNTRNNLLYSNNFNTYEKNVRIELIEVSRIEDGKAPYGNDPYDGRCFYVQNAPDLENYLYIPITLDHFEESDSDDEGSSGGDIHIRGPLYIKAVEGSLAVKIAPSHGFSQEEVNNLSGVYLYKVGNDQDWQEITDFENDEIHLSQNQFVYFRCTNDRFIPEFTNQKFIHFLIEDLGNDSKAEVGGNLNSIRQYASPYGYFGLFRFCDTIISAENLIIDNINGAAKGYCAEMFLGCTNLVKPPRSISTVAELSHRAMFKNCSSLIRSPMLTPVKVAFGCYFEMFDGCTSLAKLWCSAKSIYLPRELHIQDPRLDMVVGPYSAQSNVPTLPSINVGSWLDNASQTGEFYCTNSVQPVGRPRPIELPDYWEDLVPEGWLPKAFNSAEFFNEEVAETPANEDQSEDELPFTPKYKRDYLITSGSASDNSYGRGNVTKKSTLYNMKTINPLFDADAPNTGEYSIDGSYNQDVWGWKCFNGPVSFRNGIYGENASLITDNSHHSNGDGVSLLLNRNILDENQESLISLTSYTPEGDSSKTASVLLYTSSTDERNTSVVAGIEIKSSEYESIATVAANEIKIQGSDFVRINSNQIILGNTIGDDTQIITRGNIFPLSSLRDSIGTPDKKYKSIYVSELHVSDDSIIDNLEANNLIVDNASIGTDLTVDGNINANSNVVVAGNIDVSGDVNIAGSLTISDYLRQESISTHVLEVVNKDEDGNIEYGQFNCYGKILTYQSIKPAYRILHPSAETITALTDGYLSFTPDLARDTIYESLDDYPDNLGLSSEIINSIVDEFALGNDYYLNNDVVLTSSLYTALTRSLVDLGIEHICSIEPSFTEEGTIDNTIGLPDRLECSYNGYFNTIKSNKLISNRIYSFNGENPEIKFILDKSTASKDPQEIVIKNESVIYNNCSDKFYNEYNSVITNKLDHKVSYYVDANSGTAYDNGINSRITLRTYDEYYNEYYGTTTFSTGKTSELTLKRSFKYDNTIHELSEDNATVELCSHDSSYDNYSGLQVNSYKNKNDNTVIIKVNDYRYEFSQRYFIPFEEECNLGSNRSRWDTAYVNDVNTLKLSHSNSTIDVDAWSIRPVNDSVRLGEFEHRWNNIYAKNIDVDDLTVNGTLHTNGVTTPYLDTADITPNTPRDFSYRRQMPYGTMVLATLYDQSADDPSEPGAGSPTVNIHAGYIIDSMYTSVTINGDNGGSITDARLFIYTAATNHDGGSTWNHRDVQYARDADTTFLIGRFVILHDLHFHPGYDHNSAAILIMSIDDRSYATYGTHTG